MSRSAPQCEVVTVTPDMAVTWLGNGASDRKMIDSRVRRFERILRAGRWQLTWDALAFDTLGRRRNGQHRLTAIVSTGISAPLLVVRGITPGAVDVGDQGAKRTMRQVLERHGEAHPGALAGALRLLWQWQQGRVIGDRSQDAVPDIADMQATLDEHPTLRDCVATGRRMREQAKLGSDGLGTTLAYLFTLIDPENGEAFLHRLISGVDLVDEGDPILQLRHRLLDLHGATSRSKGIDVTYKAALCIKAFNAWRVGSHARLLWRRGGASPEAFPTIDAPPEALVDVGG
jgi:hypothetical protein